MTETMKMLIDAVSGGVSCRGLEGARFAKQIIENLFAKENLDATHWKVSEIPLIDENVVCICIENHIEYKAMALYVRTSDESLDDVGVGEGDEAYCDSITVAITHDAVFYDEQWKPKNKEEMIMAKNVMATTVEEVLENEMDVFEVDSETSKVFKELVQKFNDAVVDEDTTAMMQIDKMLKDALKALNDEEKAAQLNIWAQSEKPVLTCLLDGGTFALTSMKRDKDTGTIEISGKSAIVDLKDLFKVAPDAFAHKHWMAYAEAANVAIRDYIASVMKIKTFTEKLSGFKLSATAQMLGINAADMKTAKGTRAALQKVVDSIVAEYTVTAEDAEAFRFNYSTWGNKAINSVSLSMEVSFRKMLTRILVRIVNEMEYVGE